MILKSYLVEDNLEIIQGSLALFYGENRGQIYEIKKQITNKNKPNKILKYNQDEILGNQDNFYNEIKNVSLFGVVSLFDVVLLFVVLVYSIALLFSLNSRFSNIFFLA